MYITTLACQVLHDAVRQARVAVALIALVLAVPAAADDLSDFNATVESAMSHHRVALGYLRTGNVDLAAIEIENFREMWARVAALRRPAAFNAEAYTATVLQISTGIVGTLLVLDMGRPEVARDSLSTMRAALSSLRRAANAEVLADCVLDANVMTDLLMAFRDQPPDLANDAVRREVAAKAAASRDILARCDGMAPPGTRNAPEFRRLVDGALASLAQIPGALEARDGDLLNRLLRELQSFDNLLAFRYG